MSTFWFLCVCLVAVMALTGGSMAQEMLHNGIQLPTPWPPRLADFPDNPVTPPYLTEPPAVIPIDVGRQLLVDDFLIEATTLKRMFHLPEYHAAGPVLKPDQPWESWGKGPMAMPFSDGVWFDPKDNLFKMWYYAGHGGGATCYATSRDGIQWEKPKLDVVPDTNIVHKAPRDSGMVWLDHGAADPEQRFKMALYAGGMFALYRSADGIYWTKVGDGAKTGDRSTFQYDPFRQRWVFSVRSGSKRGRSRHYWDTADFFRFSEDARTKEGFAVWVASDNADPKREDMKTACQLYNLDCVAYESLFIGLFSIWRGDYRSKPPTEKAAELQRLGRPKTNSVCIGFSRDGFHWDRPDRREFCPLSEKMGDWNWGNVQSAGGCCLVKGDKLYFHVSGRKGVPGSRSSGVCATGLATLRRDGFASMDAGSAQGTLTTRPVRFSGKHLFVNVAAQGQLQAEILDEQGQVIEPFTKANCVAVTDDKALATVKWTSPTKWRRPGMQVQDLSALAGKPVKFRFHLTNGRLYAFWVSPEASGASHGYVAACGPGFTGPTDTVGAARD